MVGHHALAASMVIDTERSDPQLAVSYGYGRLPFDFGMAFFRQAGLVQNAPGRPVFVQQEARAKQAAVVVTFNGFFQVIDRFVDPVFLLEQQRGIEPRGRVVGVQGPCKVKLLESERVLLIMRKGFAQIAAQERALRFERRRHEQIVTPLLVLTSANPAQSPSQPGVAERAVGGDGLVERRERVVDPILRGKDKPLERDGLSIARR